MSRIVAFDRFVLDPVKRRLLSNGEPVALSTPGLRLLIALAERPGVLLTKDELIRSVWGSAAVGDNTLHVQVAALRRAIGNHRIATYSGQGYKLVLAPAIPPPSPKSPKQAAERGALIGRERLQREICRSLRAGLLVTLTGAAGVGKTALARALVRMLGRVPAADGADTFPEEIHFVDAAGAGSSAEDSTVAEAVAASLRSIRCAAVVVRRLRSSRGLLVLDGCDPVRDAAGQLAAQLHEEAQGWCVLATCRQSLGCPHEMPILVPPLPLPDSAPPTLAEARRNPSLRLLFDRLVAADPAFVADTSHLAAATRLCGRLDGLPLAIELAAPWAANLGLAAVERKLASSPMPWVHSRRPDASRHRDMRAALDWTYALLPESERAALQIVSTFAGSFALEAAEEVAEAALGKSIFADLASLVDKSFVAMQGRAGQPSYRLLNLTRQFVLDTMGEAGLERAARLAHAGFLLRRTTNAEAEWDHASGAEWVTRYGKLADDVGQALEWCFRDEASRSLGVALTAVSCRLWREVSRRSEGARWIEQALHQVDASVPVLSSAQLHHGLGMMYGDEQPERACANFERAADLYRDTGDRKRLGGVLQNLSLALFACGDRAGAMRASEEGASCLEGTGSLRTLAMTLDIRLYLMCDIGDFVAAREAGLQALKAYRMLGADRSAFTVESNLVEIALHLDEFDRAIEAADTLATRLRDTVHAGLRGAALLHRAAALAQTGRTAEARAAAEEARPLLDGFRPAAALIDHLALASWQDGRIEEAATLLGCSESLYARASVSRQPIEKKSVERLEAALSRHLSEAERLVWTRAGASLPETMAWSMALQEALPVSERV